MEIPLDKVWKQLGPRPTVLITSRDDKGRIDAAPYSFVGAISFDPPLVWVGFMKNQLRQTYENIKKTKEFVINAVSEDFANEAIECGKLQDKFNKLEKVKLEIVASKIVKVPTIKKSKIVLECKYYKEIDIGGSHRIIIGKVVKSHTKKVNEWFHPDHKKLKTIMHVSGPDFHKVGDHLELNWKKTKTK